VLIEAYREKDVAVIHVEDDGRGVDVAKVREGAVSRGLLPAEEAESAGQETILKLLFAPGMSTAAEVSEISGRGVGLDAVKAGVQGLGGSVDLRSRAGGGTQFTLRIPFSASILRALIVRIGEDILAVPIPKLHRAFEAGAEDLLDGARGDAAGRFCRFEKELLPARCLAGLLGFKTSGEPDPARGETRPVIVADTRSGRTALLVDDLVGEEEVFVKPLGRPLTALESLSGITVLGNGRPVFVLDPYGLETVIPPEACEGGDSEKEFGA
ncbi:MAG: chemotaxis protein CheW, partial [Myxococcota bacterium]